MNLHEIIELLDAEVITIEDINLEIVSACGSDLMSDVMAFVKENVMLLTGLVNPQVIRTAEMMDIKVVAFVRGKKPQDNIVQLAKEKGITVLSIKHPMFIACGKLYSAGITGRGVWN